MSIYGFDEHKNKVLLSDMVPTDVPVPSVLADGSVIYYDRGSNYGQYNLTDGVITRVSDGMDNGSPSSNYWRYLIISKTVYSGTRLSANTFYNASEINFENNWTTNIGYGLNNTNLMLKYTDLDVEQYVFPQIYRKRQTDGYNWFIPAGFEMKSISLMTDDPSEYGINLLDYVLTSNGRYVDNELTIYTPYKMSIKAWSNENVSITNSNCETESWGNPVCVPLVRRV